MAVQPFQGVWRLSYVDGSGRRSERVVEAISIMPFEGDCELTAFCRLRQDERTFMASRIAAMVEEDTGRELHELGGVRFVNMTVRNARGAESYLTNEADRLSAAIVITAKGEPTVEVIRAMIDFLPDDPYVGDVDAEAVRTAATLRYDSLGIEEGYDAVRQLPEFLRPWARADRPTRERVGQLVATPLQHCRWPEEVCMGLFNAIAETLALNIKVTKKS